MYGNAWSGDGSPLRNAPMPRGATILSDVRSPTIELVCEQYQRRWRYNVERLIEKHGPT